VEQQQPGERRERRFARPAEEEGPRPGSFAPDVTAEASATGAAAPSTAIESPPQTPSADGDEKSTEGAEGEIMTRLPRSRPERRSTRRTGATGQRRRTTTARSANSRKKAAATKKTTKQQQPARGLREQITDATIQTATMPFRATFALARRAGRLVGRLR
jgi:hypothetical protein